MKNIFYGVVNLIFILAYHTRGNAQTLSYEVAGKPWAAGLGDHRAILSVARPSGAVRLKIAWRLHDLHPDENRFLIICAATGDTIENVYRISVNNEQCDIGFGPVAKPGNYYFYYLPFKPDPDPGHG